jgi:hypothetical protein
VRQTVYDGNWQRQRISQAVYHERFTDAERRYVSLLQILIAALHSTPAEGGPKAAVLNPAGSRAARPPAMR